MRPISASQIETFDLCNRKWWIKYILGRDDPPGPSAALGSRVHKQLERWLRDGVALDLTTREGEIALQGIHLLPPPRTPGLTVEGKFSFDLFGIPFLGFKDAEYEAHEPIVYDHKTTGDYKWAKSADDLKTNAQAAIYAAETFARTGAPAVHLQWTYLLTKAKGAKPVRLRVVREDIERTLEKVYDTAGKISALWVTPLELSQVPYNPGSCEAFGGCPYKTVCNLTERERFTAIMTQGAAPDFLAQLQATGINPPIPQQFAAQPMAPQQFMPPQAQQMVPQQAPVPQQFMPQPTQQMVPQQFAPQAQQQAQQIPQFNAPAPSVETPIIEVSPAAKRGRPRKDANVAAAPAQVEDERQARILLLCSAARLIDQCARMLEDL